MEVVIYTQRVEVVESYGERRDCADQNIVRFIEACGYMAVPVPNVTSDLRAYVDRLAPKGIILTGGNSLLEYGGNAPERDRTDEVLIEIAIEKKIPLYGFCRGMQSILHYFKCPLAQVQGHVAIKHDIMNSTKEQIRKVNSYHNQACMAAEVKEPLEVLAQSEDGVAEWIKHKSLPMMGTMWHPERENPFDEEDVYQVKQLFNKTRSIQG